MGAVTATVLLALALAGVTGCATSDARSRSAGSSSCLDLVSDARFAGEGTPIGGLETDASAQCVVAFPGQGAALKVLGITTSCPKEGAVFVTFDRQEDGLTWMLDREASAVGNRDSCGFSQVPDPVVITNR